jgi:hypothetical protein
MIGAGEMALSMIAINGHRVAARHGRTDLFAAVLGIQQVIRFNHSDFAGKLAILDYVAEPS